MIKLFTWCFVFFFLFFIFVILQDMTSVLLDSRVGICSSWWLDFSWWQGWKTWCIPIAGLTWRLLMMTRLIFSFLWDFPNSRVHLIFFTFQGHNHDFSVIISSMILFSFSFFFSILLNFFEDFPVTNKNICAMLWG